ncbi:MAG: PAS domain S-box protein [Chloroflexi bacterium]|nr:PAS domain S-box protein [Chloroflexota bacterium]
MDDHMVLQQWVLTEYQDVLLSLPDGAIIIDTGGVIRWVNPAALIISGYADHELVGEQVEKLIPERFQLAHLVHRSTYNDHPWPRPMGTSSELMVRHKQGHEVPVLISLIPWQTPEHTFVTAFLRDMSEQKALETAVQQANERLEREVKERTADLLLTNQKLREEISEKQRVESELRLLSAELARRQELLMEELHSLETYSRSPASKVTARTYHLLPLDESLPETFSQLTREYESLLEMALQIKTYKGDRSLSEKLRKLAEQLGSLNAGPQDVTHLHSLALTHKVTGAPQAKAAVYFQEGRLLVLQLMGYLAAYYRSYSLDFLRKHASANDADSSWEREDNDHGG